MLEVTCLVTASLSLVLDIVGLSIPYWIYWTSLDFTFHVGLWVECLSDSDTCLVFPIVPDSLQLIRALETIGMLVLAAAVLCYMLKTFCLKQQMMLPVLGAALAIIAGLLVIIGCVLFVTKFKKDHYGEDAYTLHAAFYLCLVAALGACVSGVLTCFNRKQ